MVKVSAGTLTRYKNMAEKMQERVKKVREKGEAVMEEATGAMVTTGTAFGLGVIQGKTGGTEIAGLPLDLLVGVGAHVGGFMKLGGRSSKHLHHVGNGALALYAGTMGRGIGAQWKATGRLGGLKTAPALSAGESGADWHTDAELATSVLRR